MELRRNIKNIEKKPSSDKGWKCVCGYKPIIPLNEDCKSCGRTHEQSKEEKRKHNSNILIGMMLLLMLSIGNAFGQDVSRSENIPQPPLLLEIDSGYENYNWFTLSGKQVILYFNGEKREVEMAPIVSISLKEFKVKLLFEEKCFLFLSKEGKTLEKGEILFNDKNGKGKVLASKHYLFQIIKKK